MYNKILIPFLSVFLFQFSFGQDLKEIQKQMTLINAGKCEIGGGYQYEVKGSSMFYLGFDGAYADQNKDQVAIGEVPLPNNPRQEAVIHSFYISQKEVTNKQYREFLLYSLLDDTERDAFLKKAKSIVGNDANEFQNHWQTLFDKASAAGSMPNQECWSEDFVFAYNKPLVDNYFTHPAFDNYPVVGVSWTQANAYCEWLTNAVNAERRSRGLSAQPDFRLPTETEWEYAALAGRNNATVKGGSRLPVYPWTGDRIWDQKGRILANIKADHYNYVQDNYEYTSPVGTFPANEYGLYDMGGNVAEWTLDHFRINSFSEDSPNQVSAEDSETPNVVSRVVKGGSWADYRYAAQVGSRCKVDESRGYARVGFRVATTLTHR